VSEELVESTRPFCHTGSSELFNSGGGRRSSTPHLRLDSKLSGMFGYQVLILCLLQDQPAVVPASRALGVADDHPLSLIEAFRTERIVLCQTAEFAE